MIRYPLNRKRQYHTPPAAELLDLAEGRWREILLDAGLPVELLNRRSGPPARDAVGATALAHCPGSMSAERCIVGIASPRGPILAPAMGCRRCGG